MVQREGARVPHQGGPLDHTLLQVPSGALLTGLGEGLAQQTGNLGPQRGATGQQHDLGVATQRPIDQASGRLDGLLEPILEGRLDRGPVGPVLPQKVLQGDPHGRSVHQQFQAASLLARGGHGLGSLLPGRQGQFDRLGPQQQRGPIPAGRQLPGIGGRGRVVRDVHLFPGVTPPGSPSSLVQQQPADRLGHLLPAEARMPGSPQDADLGPVAPVTRPLRGQDAALLGQGQD